MAQEKLVVFMAQGGGRGGGREEGGADRISWADELSGEKTFGYINPCAHASIKTHIKHKHTHKKKK